MITRLLPLGAQATLAYCGDERAAFRLADQVRRLADPWLFDVVQAYTSVAVFFDLDQIRFAEVAQRLAQLAADAARFCEASLVNHPGGGRRAEVDDSWAALPAVLFGEHDD